MREVIVDPQHRDSPMPKRVDTLGEYAFRYTDDGGRTWSERRHIPVRTADIDRRNPYRGEVKFF